MDNDADNTLRDWQQIFEKIGDQWSFAFRAMFKREGSDLKPLAALLRSGDPVPLEVRRSLAELLDPGEPDYLGFRFNLKATKIARQKKAEARQARVYLRFTDLRDRRYPTEEAAKKTDLCDRRYTTEEAAEQIAQEFGISERTVYLDVSAEEGRILRELGGGDDVAQALALLRKGQFSRQ